MASALWLFGGILAAAGVLIAALHVTGRVGFREWRYGNLVSLRVWVSATVAPLLLVGIPAALLSMYVWEPLGYLAYLGVVLMPFALLAMMDPGNPAYCDRCGKRVKLGSSTCHHCGHRHALG